MTRPSVNDLFT